MAELINLHKARKQNARAQEKTRAAENRARHGRHKAGKRLDAARAKKSGRDLEGHRLAIDDCE